MSQRVLSLGAEICQLLLEELRTIPDVLRRWPLKTMQCLGHNSLWTNRKILLAQRPATQFHSKEDGQVQKKSNNVCIYINYIYYIYICMYIIDNWYRLIQADIGFCLGTCCLCNWNEGRFRMSWQISVAKRG
jgi:hypothetical protein